MKKESAALWLDELGMLATAEQVRARAYATVPAYRSFSPASAGGDTAFRAAPVSDKANYLRSFPYRDLLADDADTAFTVFASSGSSGKSFYWPQLRSSQQENLPRLRQFLETAFAVQQHKTLAIIGLALGSWIGGEHLSWALKSLALSLDYPFCVFSPGSNHDEIIGMIVNSDPFIDQFLLCLCPSAIAHLQLRAEGAGVLLPMHKIRFIVLGEAFPEDVRSALQAQSGRSGAEPVMLSLYGSADTGVLGVESAPSVALRRLLTAHPALAQQLGLTTVVPHFFHHVASDAFLESPHGELLVTRWQGVPLVRYNLHDAVRFWSWSRTRQAVLDWMAGRPDESGGAALLAATTQPLPDLLAVAGRADSTLILCGTNLSETMLDAAVRCRELQPFLTGTYTAKITYQGGRQRLAFDLEFKQSCPMSNATIETIYGLLIKALGEVQPEFRDDWRNVYQLWDADPEKRILALHGQPWPLLSERVQQKIKHRGIQS